MISRQFFWMGSGLGLFLVSFGLPTLAAEGGARLGYEAFMASVEQLGFFFAALYSPECSFSSFEEALVILYLGSLWLLNLIAPLSQLAFVRRAAWMRSALVLCSLLPLGVFFTFLRDDLCVGFYVWAASLLVLASAACGIGRSQQGAD